jgi:hypothetical protein
MEVLSVRRAVIFRNSMEQGLLLEQRIVPSEIAYDVTLAILRERVREIQVFLSIHARFAHVENIQMMVFLANFAKWERTRCQLIRSVSNVP